MRIVITIPVPDEGIAMSEVKDIVTEVAQQLPVTLDHGAVDVHGYATTWVIDDEDY